MYVTLLLLIYLAFVSLGLPDSLLGAGWPVMQAAFDVPLSYAGVLSFITSAGTIFSSLLSDRLTKKIGTAAVTIASVFLTAAALLGYSVSTSAWMLCLFSIPYGLGAGAIDAALNNYVALHYSSRHMTWLHSFWGLGAIISPYVMSFALSHSVWNDGYRIVALLQIIIAVVLLLTRKKWKVNENGDAAETGGKVLSLWQVLKIRGVVNNILGFLCYCSGEACAMLWASSYLAGYRGVSEETAAAFASLVYIGITAGRFLSGFITDKFGDRKMIRMGTAIVSVGILCIALPLKTDILCLAGFLIVGFGCAPIYPCIVHSTPYNFGAENSQAIIGVQMAGAYLGYAVVSPMFGVLASVTSLGILPLYLSVFFAMMILMVERTYRITSA